MCWFVSFENSTLLFPNTKIEQNNSKFAKIEPTKFEDDRRHFCNKSGKEQFRGDFGWSRQHYLNNIYKFMLTK